MLAFAAFAKNVKIKPKSSLYLDNLIFRLHYRMTFWFLMAATVLVCARQYIGEHINCIADSVLKNVINTYCFIQTTFTVVRHHGYNASMVAHPGVGPFLPGDLIKRHAYYQWVPFVLFGQACTFYACHYFWKLKEKGRIQALCSGISENFKDHTDKNLLKDLADNLLTWFKMNRDWGMWFVSLELLNMVNLVLQILFTDMLMGGEFLDLGVRWIHDADTDNLLDYVFPKVTKCTFRKYGSSGSLQVHDAICIVALNIIHEKIYIILWFWWLTLCILSIVGFLWRILTFLLHSRSTAFNRWVWGEVSPGPVVDLHDAVTVTSAISFYDWLLLYYLGKNMDPPVFRGFVAQLAQSVRHEPSAPVSPDNPKATLLAIDTPDSQYLHESEC